MAEKDLRKWTVFFHEAGVPSGPAKEYATLFCDHRIKEALLGDLTKDILNDIGINVMGDVMSILKHARAVYAKLEREKSSNQIVIQDDEDKEPIVKLPTKQNPSLQSGALFRKKKSELKLANKPNTDAQQTEVLTTAAKKKLAMASEPKITLTVNDSAVVPKKRPVKTAQTLSERFANETASSQKVSCLSVQTNKFQATKVAKAVNVKSLSSAKSVSSYKAGTSMPVKRKSAFERLGKEGPNTASKNIKQLTPNIKVAKLAKSPITAPTSKVISLTKNESSVFNRLGGETEASLAASTARKGALTVHTGRGLGSRIVSGDTQVKSHSAVLPLKPIRAVQPVKPVSSVKARVSAEAPKELNKKSVFSRLGSPT